MRGMVDTQPSLRSNESTYPDVSNLFIPEQHFWQPEAAKQFLDHSGRPRRTPSGEPDFEKIPVPLIDADAYPIVSIPALARAIKSLHISEYRYPKRYVKTYPDGNTSASRIFNDNIDHVQNQHLYSDAHGAKIDEQLWRFCDDAERKMELPWIAHNCKTIFFDDPPLPSGDLAAAHLEGARLSSNLFQAAALMLRVGTLFDKRRASLETGKVVPLSDIDDRTGVDQIAKDDFCERQQKIQVGFQYAKEAYADQLPPESIFWHHREEVLSGHPANIARILGTVATSAPWNYSRYFRHNLDPVFVIREHKNTLAARATTMRRLFAV